MLTEYFKELEEESIRDNFVVLYELLDEVMDWGYPQTTESKILQEYVSFAQRGGKEGADEGAGTSRRRVTSSRWRGRRRR